MSRAHLPLAVLGLLVALTSSACGGSDKPASKTPETEPIGTSATPDMPPPPESVAPAASAAPTTDAPAPGVPDPNAAPATLALPSATAKIAMKGKKTANVELKSDGTVTNGGKTVAKVNGSKLESADGKTVLAVEKDAVTTADGNAYATFAGDDLTMTKTGDKLALGDDGKLTLTSSGKASDLGKVDGASAAKRAAVLAAAFVLAPPAAEKPTATAKPTGDKAGATAKPASGDKPKK